MSPASMAPGSARSAPKAKPDKAHTATKACSSPAPKRLAHTNTATASSMPINQLRAKPKRLTSASHSGMDRAAHKK